MVKKWNFSLAGSEYFQTEGESGFPDLIAGITPFTRQLLVCLGFSEDYEFILKHRYGLEGSEIFNLEEIGSILNVSKERVRQREKRSLEILSRALTGEFPGVFIPEQVIAEFSLLYDQLRNLGEVITEQEALACYANRIGKVSTKIDTAALRLIFRVMGFKKLREIGKKGVQDDHLWVTVIDFDRDTFYEAIKSSLRVLHHEIKPLSLKGLAVTVNRGRKKKVSLHVLRLACKVTPEIEILAPDQVQIRFQALKSLADKAYRLLQEKESSLEFRDLVKEINHRQVSAGASATATLESLSTQMAIDNRFVAIGKSGCWELREWKKDSTGTIVQVMHNFFSWINTSAKVKDILGYVQEKRPDASKKSVLAYLYQKERFTRVGEGEYVPVEWGWKEQPSKKIIKKPKQALLRMQVQEFIWKKLSAKPNEWIQMKKLCDAAVKEIGCKSPTFYSYLSSLEWIEKDLGKGRSGKYCRLSTVSSGNPIGKGWKEVIAGGENGQVEFKRDLRWSHHLQNGKPPEEQSDCINKVIKEIAGFMNTKDGGWIFLGVDDQTGEILGIDHEYELFNKSKKNRDGFELALRDKINTQLGNDLASFYEFNFQKLDGKEVCRITVKVPSKIVYLKDKIYQRAGNQIVTLENPKQIADFAQERVGKPEFELSAKVGFN